MKTILVASDLSARSDWAIERAAKLAADHDCRLIVLHVVDDELPARVADRLREEAEASLREVVSGLAPSTVEIKCMFGEHFAAIIDAAENVEADLVVIGKHREDALLDLFRGSTGERVIRFGKRPVLVVKRRPSHSYSRLMAAIDFSPVSARAIAFAAELVRSSPSIHVVHAFHIPFKGFLHGGKSFDRMAKRQQEAFGRNLSAEMEKFFALLTVDTARIERTFEEGIPRDVILQAILKNSPDLVVVGTHGRSGLARAIVGSVAESILSEAPCDVLAIPGA